MREYKFRGKRADNGELVDGLLLVAEVFEDDRSVERYFIVTESHWDWSGIDESLTSYGKEVHPESVHLLEESK